MKTNRIKVLNFAGKRLKRKETVKPMKTIISILIILMLFYIIKDIFFDDEK